MTEPATAENPLEHRTQQERVYHQLRELILRGKFEPGNSVTLRGLADMLDVSLMPVRESLRRLTTERALQLLDNRRIAVPSMTQEKLEELYHTRVSLESFAAAKALKNIDAEAIEKLREVNDRHNEAILNKDVENYIYLNFEFHRLLYSYGDLQVVSPLIESLWLQVAPFMRKVFEKFATAENFSDSEDKHMSIMEAIENRNATRLNYLIHDDILDGVRILQEAMGWPISN